KRHREKSAAGAIGRGDVLMQSKIAFLHTGREISAPGALRPRIGQRRAGIDQITLRGEFFGQRGLAIAGRDADPAMGGRAGAHHRRGGGKENVAGAIAELECGLGRRSECHQRQHHQPCPLALHPAVISVPAPCSVNNSSRSTWGMRPSRMTAASTPDSTAATAVLILGIMPPEMVPLAIKARASLAVRREINFFSWSSTPSTSVSRIKRSALTAPATAPATVSALMLKVSPCAPTPMGAMTGMISERI